MATIQFGGLISGLDTNALIDGLVTVQRQTINLLTAQKVIFQAQDGTLSLLSGSLASLKSAAQGLALSIDFKKRSVESSATSVLTVTADSTAQVGAHNVTITALAKAHSLKSSTQTSATAEIGTGTFSLTVAGTQTNFTIDAANNTLTGLKDAINASTVKVTASIVNVGTSSSADYRLVLESDETGTENAITVNSSLTGGNANDPFSAGGVLVQAAADAVFTVNGLAVTRSSNTVSDVIQGVTFSLLKVDSANISVENDTNAMTSAIQGLVDAYNTVTGIANDQFSFDSVTNSQGVLAGDAVLRGVISRLRTELSAQNRNSTTFVYLSDIGVRFEDDGTLSLDTEVLQAALDSDLQGVQDLFLSAKNGIGLRLPEMIDDYISVAGGILTARQAGINASVSDIDAKIAREEIRIAALEQRLIDQFTALETTISRLNSQSTFLSQQLAALPPIGSNKK